jgi:hypothetical protein
MRCGGSLQAHIKLIAPTLLPVYVVSSDLSVLSGGGRGCEGGEAEEGEGCERVRRW